MEIQYTSPNVFLQRSSVVSAALPTPVRKTSKQTNSNASILIPASNSNLSNETNPRSNISNGNVQKPKQSKSRNGCITCKKKRLKCDETKPTCVQCEKRNVECEGYKKDYKWRTFEETTKNSKAAKTRKTSITSLDPFSGADAQVQSHSSSKSPTTSTDQLSSWTPQLQNAFNTATQAFSGSSPPPNMTSPASPPTRLNSTHHYSLPTATTTFNPPLPHSLSAVQYGGNGMHSHQNDTINTEQSPTSHTSPNLADLLLPGTNMREPPDPSELRPPMSPHPYRSDFVETTASTNTFDAHEEDFDEEIVRQPEVQSQSLNPQWSFLNNPSNPSEKLSGSSISTDLSIIRPPQLDPASPEMLLLRFDKQTCGILSVKDGPNENPWRTLMWPFAKTSPALYHAISSMAALHGSLSDPKLRLSGMAHMNKSVKELCSSLDRMSSDQGLAVSLALALGEGWDERISTGMQHLKGARVLVDKLLSENQSSMQVQPLSLEKIKRDQFLCNTYVYLDVIARLTSKGKHEPVDFAAILQAVNGQFEGGYVEIDPLMGCATTLFPIIGKVATLIQRARNMAVNSLQIVSEADTLQKQLLGWQPPNANLIEQPEDFSSSARDALQTAEAYRIASLLYLHQAVPELPCEPAHKLARSILAILDVVPLSSRTVIIQIFPLLMASCEMVSPQERYWVTRRWEGMMQRLSIVNVKSCWKLVQEIWKRRDAYTNERVRTLAAKSVMSANVHNLSITGGQKRKTSGVDLPDEDVFQNFHGQSSEFSYSQDNRPVKRRFTMDASTGSEGDEMARMHMISIPRRHTDADISTIDPEYTIRGDLHWLKFFLAEDDDEDVFLLHDSFTFANCVLLADKSFQTNSGEFSLSPRVLAR